MMNSPENKPPVTLEDLLRLKRAERPSPEFWSKFEAQLRAKQLAAIVEKRPWWRDISLVAIARHRVLVGATALLAISFVSIREYRAVSSRSHQPAAVPQAAEVAVLNSAEVAPVSAVVPETVAASVSSPAIEKPAIANEVVGPAGMASREFSSESSAYTGAAPMEIATAANSADEAPAAAHWLLAADRAEAGRLSPAARSIADNLAAAKEAHPELTNRFFGVSGFEKRSMPSSRPTVDPLAQMRSPSETHLRVLASSVRSSSSINSGRDSERIVRRISDQRLTEEAISRFGARGNELSVKF